MHAKLKPIKSSPGDQISAKGVLFWQICCEVHFLPLVSLLDVLISWETELSQMPSLNEIKLTGLWLLIDNMRVTLFSEVNLIRVAL